MNLMRHNLTTVLNAAVLCSVAFTLSSRAQLVPDGGTLNLTTTTNFPGNLVIGQSVGSTTLNIISPGALTNNSALIGEAVASSSNLVTVQNSGAIWHNAGSLTVGGSGPNNGVVISNGGRVVAVGDGALNTSAEVEIVGPGSLWSVGMDLTVGHSCELMISNGGTAASENGRLNTSSAVVTGTGSLWTNRARLNIGDGGPQSRLVISNGAAVGQHHRFPRQELQRRRKHGGGN